ncbi:MAG: zinc ribbon domain-containing protein [Clostridia bacterium]|nr:zinc ribbon domain-containing protein [Clostridia bacterium]
MGFVLGFLGACLGIVAGVGIIVAVIYIKVRSVVGPANMKELAEVAKNAKNIEQQEYMREKNVGGITKLIEPVIIRDFGDFNKDFLFSKVEKNLIKIFTAIECKSIDEIKNDDDLIYMYSTIRDKIKDIKDNNVNIKYDDVQFHAHAIKDYSKSDGKATITLSSTLEYYYSNDSDKHAEKKFAGLKKQTRYTTQFVYVYDETKFKYNQKAITISCPNCGAPLNKLGAGNCQYCGTYIKPINLKGWYMVSYKEDYK